METIVRELEQVSFILMHSVDPEERRQAERMILKFRSQEQPYNLCMTILGESNNEFLLYEAGRCLSNAVVSEWNQVFAEPNNETTENSKAFQLLSFLLEWAKTRGSQVSAAARMRVLGAAGALVKRAAAGHAELMAFFWRQSNLSQNSSFNQDSAEPHSIGDGSQDEDVLASQPRVHCPTLDHPPSDPGPPCMLLLRLVDHIENLIRSCIVVSDINGTDAVNEGQIECCLLGLRILTGFLDEMSNAEDSTNVTLPLEAHIFLRARFENFELVQLFRLLLCLLEAILESWGRSMPVCSLDSERAEIVFRLISSLDTITSWNFLPHRLIWFRISKACGGDREVSFCPSTKWAPFFTQEALSTTLLAFIKLHSWVRSSEMLGTRTLSCILRISSMNGPLINTVSFPGGNQEEFASFTGVDTSSAIDTFYADRLATVTPSPYSLHLLTCIDHMNYWLICDPAVDDFGGLDNDDLMNSGLAIKDASPPVAISVNLTQLPRLMLPELSAYELSIFSEVFQALVLHIFTILDPIKSVLRPSPSMTARRDIQMSIYHALMALAVVERFCLRTCTLLLQCIRTQADRAADVDGEGQLAHEATQRLFNTWTDLVTAVTPSSSADNFVDSSNPLALTADSLGVAADPQFHPIISLLNRLRTNVMQQQSRLFEAYVLSKLSSIVLPELGLRRSMSTGEEDIDVELDEPDVIDSEESLFAVSFCGLVTPEQSTHLLLHLIDERVERVLAIYNKGLASGDENETFLFELLEDLHWLLLITGHFLVSGPSVLDSALKSSSTEHMVPEIILQFTGESGVDVDASRCLLLTVVSRPLDQTDPWPPNHVMISTIPALIRLFASLFRLLWLQVSLGLGSAQLTEDNVWVMSRIAITYICCTPGQSTKSTSAILTILHPDPVVSNPPLAHTAQSRLASTGGVDEQTVLQTIIRALLTCAHMAFTTWSSETKLLSTVTRLIALLSQHTPDARVNLVCPAWFSLSKGLLMLCGSEGGDTDSATDKASGDTGSGAIFSSLTKDSLMELTQACICGSWAIDNKQLTVGALHLNESLTCATGSQNVFEAGDTFLLQLLRSLRLRLFHLFECFSQSKHTQVASGTLIDQLVNSLAILRGLARSVKAFAHRNNAIADVVSLIWTSLLKPTLDCATNILILYWDNCTEVIQNLLLLFTEVTDYCLIYLFHLPTAQAHDNGQGSASNSGMQRMHSSSSPVSTQFLQLIVTMCKHYAQRNVGKFISEATDEDERVVELGLLFKLLKAILVHEFQSSACLLPLSSSNVNARPVDMVVVSLDCLLPLVNDTLLVIPDLSENFYTLLSHVCELRVESLSNLSAAQLQYFGQLLRHGIFGHPLEMADNNGSATTQMQSYSRKLTGAKQNNKVNSRIPNGSVSHVCLEILTLLSYYCLEVHEQVKRRNCAVNGITDNGADTASRLVTFLGLNEQLLTELFAMVTHEVPIPTSIRATLASAIFALIHIIPASYLQLVHRWLASCNDTHVRERLSRAFQKLAAASLDDQLVSPSDNDTMHSYAIGLNMRKPSCRERVNFEQRFCTFIADVRPFACRC